MNPSQKNPLIRRHALLASAITMVLATPIYAADAVQSASQDDATVEQRSTSPAGAKDRQKPDKAADNTARNIRDRGDATLTPMDQSSSEADVEITRTIRQLLIDDDSLGTNARNVKVITVNRTVTLRGPVRTAAEHARVVTLAKDIAGIDRVVDELEVINR